VSYTEHASNRIVIFWSQRAQIYPTAHANAPDRADVAAFPEIVRNQPLSRHLIESLDQLAKEGLSALSAYSAGNLGAPSVPTRVAMAVV
jgi:hypothetical protein